MHLSWRDFEILSSEDMSSWRKYVRYPHLLFCAKCRRELKMHDEDRSLISDLKAAYVRDEGIHVIMASKGLSRRL